MAKSKCVPLKIICHLRDGRFSSADGIIMLDSIVYHAWFIKYAPEVLDGIYDFDKAKYIGLPFKQLEGNRWAASKGIYTELEQRIEYYNKRPDFFAADKYHFLNLNKGLLSDSVGIYRAYRNPLLIRTVKDGNITFFAVGHKKELQELLDLMIGVGKKSAMGFGIIEKWDIIEIDEDYTTEHPEHGLMRPLEVNKTEKKYDCPIMLYSVKPPYWKKDNMRLCYVPI